MATTFESAVKTINASDRDVFAILSDLRNAEGLKEKIPHDKVKDIELTRDSVSFVVEPAGAITLNIIDRDPSKTIKFAADKSPVDFFLWIQLKQVAETDTKLKITLKADLNPMIKMMVAKPMEQFINMLADALASLSYPSVSEEKELS